MEKSLVVYLNILNIIIQQFQPFYLAQITETAIGTTQKKQNGKLDRLIKDCEN